MTDHPAESAPASANAVSGKEKLAQKSTTPAPMLINAASAAVVLNIGTRLLWSLTNRNSVPHVRIGRRVAYRPDHLAAWLDAGAPTTPNAADKIIRELRRGVVR